MAKRTSPKRRRREKLTIASEPRMYPPASAFGKQFHQWLVDQGIRTMAEAATLVGYSRHTVILWRRGDREPGPSARRIMDAYLAGELVPPGKRRSRKN